MHNFLFLGQGFFHVGKGKVISVAWLLPEFAKHLQATASVQAAGTAMPVPLLIQLLMCHLHLPMVWIPAWHCKNTATFVFFSLVLVGHLEMLAWVLFDISHDH